MPTDFASRFRKPAEAEAPKSDFSARFRKPEYAEDELRPDELSVGPLEAASTVFQNWSIPGGRALLDAATAEPPPVAKTLPGGGLAPDEKQRYEAAISRVSAQPNLGQRVAEEERAVDRAWEQQPLASGLAVGASLLTPDPTDFGKAVAGAPGRIAARAGSALEDAATTAQRRALGYSKSALSKEGIDAANRSARAVLDNAQPGMLTRPPDLLQRIGQSQDEIGGRIGAAREGIDTRGGGVMIQDLATRLSGIGTGAPTRAGKALDSELAGIIDDATKYADESGRVNATGLQRLKESLSGVVARYGQQGVQDIEGKKALTEQARRVVREIEDELFSQHAPDAIADKRTYGQLESAGRQLEGRIAGDAAKPKVTALDMVLTTGGALGGPKGMLAGALTSLLYKGARAQGDQAFAVASDKAAKLLQSKWAPFLQAAGQQGGPNALMVAHNILIERDPEYAAEVGR